MVIGTGMDVIEVSRISKAVSNAAFADKLFTKTEQEYFAREECSVQVIAGMFAAKQATAKALSVGFTGIKWTEIEISFDGEGKPSAALFANALKRMKDMGGTSVTVSISYIRELAVAQSIVEG